MFFKLAQERLTRLTNLDSRLRENDSVESCADPTKMATRAVSLRQIESQTTLTVSRHTAGAFGVLAAAVKQSGRSSGTRDNDLWIAAQEIEHGYTVLTLNSTDFAGLPGLRFVNPMNLDC